MSGVAVGAPESETVLEVVDVWQTFKVGRYPVDAVAGVSLDIRRGETLGLVGESGCGKSSLARSILQLPPPTKGSVRLEGQELTTFSASARRSLRRRLQLVFQDPISSLNPRRKVRRIVAEGLTIAGDRDRAEVVRLVDRALVAVGLDPSLGDRRPHELSGGQCQRVAIARALVLEPALLVCDEPVAALDVSVQGQVLNVLDDLRRSAGLSMLFISHNLNVVAAISDRIAVMYLGRIVELGDADAIWTSPLHPYTRALIDSVPVLDPDAAVRKAALRGEPPSLISVPSGCRFRNRCPRAQGRCAEEEPELRPLTGGGSVACHFPLDESSRSASTAGDS